MDVTGFDHLTQDIGAILSRRGLLRTGALGTFGLGLGVITSQQAAARKGKQGNKKGKQRKKKVDVNALCKTQVAPCTDILTTVCAGEAKCLASVQTCCPQVATCDFGGFLACIRATQA